MAQPTENRAGFQGVEVIADIDSDSSAAELDEILRLSATRCPVSDNMSHTTPIAVRLANA